MTATGFEPTTTSFVNERSSMSVRLRTKWLWFRIPLLSLKTSDITPVLSKEFLDLQATTEHRFTLKRVRDMIITYSVDGSVLKFQGAEIWKLFRRFNQNCCLRTVK